MAQDEEFDFGKHRGKLFSVVCQNHPGYAQWVLTLDGLNNGMLRFQQYLQERGWAGAEQPKNSQSDAWWKSYHGRSCHMVQFLCIVLHQFHCRKSLSWNLVCLYARRQECIFTWDRCSIRTCALILHFYHASSVIHILNCEFDAKLMSGSSSMLVHVSISAVSI